MPSQYTLAHRQPDGLQVSAFHRARIATCTITEALGRTLRGSKFQTQGLQRGESIWIKAKSGWPGVPSFLAWAVFPSQTPSTVHYLPWAALWIHLLRGPRPQGSHGGTDYGKENSTTSDFSMKVFLCVCFIYLILTPVYELWETALYLTYINTKHNSACHIFVVLGILSEYLSILLPSGSLWPNHWEVMAELLQTASPPPHRLSRPP